MADEELEKERKIATLAIQRMPLQSIKKKKKKKTTAIVEVNDRH